VDHRHSSYVFRIACIHHQGVCIVRGWSCDYNWVHWGCVYSGPGSCLIVCTFLFWYPLVVSCCSVVGLCVTAVCWNKDYSVKFLLIFSAPVGTIKWKWKFSSECCYEQNPSKADVWPACQRTGCLCTELPSSLPAVLPYDTLHWLPVEARANTIFTNTLKHSVGNVDIHPLYWTLL
jgi:hypothetical protein